MFRESWSPDMRVIGEFMPSRAGYVTLDYNCAASETEELETGFTTNDAGREDVMTRCTDTKHVLLHVLPSISDPSAISVSTVNVSG
ncbi:hypothetical protein EYF80_011553 [Liparis tanakae]|uniref:Uncharacterized protein n=1 Tax=Liparis tanakae TaxID=230148 RepID=A0A4Z2IME3_9TELE|nr:hypothetical protein EYF80_011553 [Liparis tanakae]